MRDARRWTKMSAISAIQAVRDSCHVGAQAMPNALFTPSAQPRSVENSGASEEEAESFEKTQAVAYDVMRVLTRESGIE